MNKIFYLLSSFLLFSCNVLKSESSVDGSFSGGLSLVIEDSTISLSRSTIQTGDQTEVTLQTLDQNGNAFSAQSPLSISFESSSGGGQLTFGAVSDLGNGLYKATVSGTRSGTINTIQARVDGNALPKTTQLKVDRTAVSMANSLVSSSASFVASGSFVTITVSLRDSQNRNLVEGGEAVTLAYSGGTAAGTFSSVTDNDDGTYTATFTGSTAGTATTISAIVNGSNITSTLPTVSVTAGNPSSIAVASGNSQTGTAGSALGSAFVAVVKDASNNVLSGVSVDWTVTSGGGTLSAATSTTNTNGQASVNYTLGTTAGNNVVTATVASTALSTTFSSTGSAGTVTQLIVTQGPSNHAAGSAMSPALTVEARDANNNNNTNFTDNVSVTITTGFNPGSSTLAGTTTKAAVAGIATFSDLYLNKISTGNKLTFSSGSLSVNSSTFNVTAGAATTSVISGDSSVKAGVCTGAFTLTLQDAFGNTTTASSSTTLDLQGAGTGAFYSTSNCSAGSSITSLTIATSSSSGTFYFKSNTGGAYSLKATKTGFSDSATHSLSVTASRLKMTIASSNISATVCTGAVTLKTQDESSNDVSPAANSTVNLTNDGVAKFYSDSSCASQITQRTVTSASGTTSFYVKDPQGALTITVTASDAATTLTSGTLSLTSAAKMSFLGAYASDQSWFGTSGESAAGYDDIHFYSPKNLWIDTTHNYMYVTEDHRVKKIDLQSQSVVGWTGAVHGTAAYAPTDGPGSCIGKVSGFTDAWCKNGRAIASAATGGFYNPYGITGDSTSQTLYVVDSTNSRVVRINGDTGAVTGWIGRVSTLPTSCESGTASVGAFTPSWCTGGYSQSAVACSSGNCASIDGSMVSVRGIYYDGTYLFVGSSGRIMRYVASTGVFAGWTGGVGTAQPTGTATGNSTSCTSGGLTHTPGWCTGGDANTTQYPYNNWSVPSYFWSDGTYLYTTTDIYNGGLLRYNISTGAFAGAGRIGTWPTTTQSAGFAAGTNFGITGIGTNLYIVSTGYMSSRINRTPVATGTLDGWIGRINIQPTGGVSGCTNSAFRYLFTPGWCSGGGAHGGVDNSGSMLGALGITTDGTSLYVVDSELHRISKYSTSGTYQGWLGGKITDSDEWSSQTVATMTEGRSEYANGTLQRVAANGTHLYVTDAGSNRVRKINIKTGANEGWIGIVHQSTVTGGLVLLG